MHLTDLESIPEVSVTFLKIKEEDPNKQSPAEEALTDEEYLCKPEFRLAKETIAAFLEFLGRSDGSKKEFTFEESEAYDKTERTNFHQFLKRRWAKRIRSSTQDGKIVATFVKADNRFHSREWPASRPKYLSFVLYKANRDTTDALSTLARALG